jgi:Helix-turn-helix domain
VLNSEKSENPSHVDRQAAFSVPEAAEFFGHHPAWVYRRVYLGQLKVLRDGGRIMITRTEIERMLKRQVVHKPKARRKHRQQPEAASE